MNDEQIERIVKFMNDKKEEDKKEVKLPLSKVLDACHIHPYKFDKKKDPKKLTKKGIRYDTFGRYTFLSL